MLEGTLLDDDPAIANLAPGHSLDIGAGEQCQGDALDICLAGVRGRGTRPSASPCIDRGIDGIQNALAGDEAVLEIRDLGGRFRLDGGFL
ncbi:MAG: hypothetical protein U5R48_15570 [Gammaproteobacteria bacterium]|nr:hypothetical protein [Gammaproteobacteria bacterium]